MASQWPPKKNTAFTLYFTLYKNDGTVIANPGTYTKKVSIDGAAIADISASVTEEDTTYGQLSVVLSASEMNGDAIWVQIKDDTSGCVPFTTVLYTTGSTHDEMKTDTAAILADTGTDGVVLANDAITAAKIATGAIDADAIASDAITAAKIAAGAIDAATLADDAWVRLGVVAWGTAQSAAAANVVVAAGEGVKVKIGNMIAVYGSTQGYWQTRWVTDVSTDTVSVEAWTVTPTGTITYRVYGVAPANTTTPSPVNVTQWLGTACATPTTAGVPEVDLTHIAGAAVSTTTAQLGVNVVQLSGDGTAADNLEAAADGTGYNLGGGSVVAASVTGAVGSVTGAVGSVTGDVGGDLTGTVGGLSTQAKADVNAEVLDVLATDTQTPHTGAPAATTTILGMLKWLYLRARNKHTYTADTGTVFADDGSTPVATETHGDDATTLTKGKWS